MKRLISRWAVALGVGLATLTIALPPAVGQQPITLEPGKPVRIYISTQPSNEPGSGVIIRIQLERGESGGPAKPSPTRGKLEEELSDLYGKDQDPDKVKHAQALGQLYQWAAKALRAQGGTSGGFRKALGTKSSQLLPADVLVPMRRRVQTELRTVLPKPDDAQMDEKTREAAAKLFDRLAAATDQLAQ
jgi:hypothetical protein